MEPTMNEYEAESQHDRDLESTVEIETTGENNEDVKITVKSSVFVDPYSALDE